MGSSPTQVAKLLINNPSAQPGANTAPIDEIVRVSLGPLRVAAEGAGSRGEDACGDSEGED